MNKVPNAILMYIFAFFFGTILSLTHLLLCLITTQLSHLYIYIAQMSSQQLSTQYAIVVSCANTFLFGGILRYIEVYWGVLWYIGEYLGILRYMIYDI